MSNKKPTSILGDMEKIVNESLERVMPANRPAQTVAKPKMVVAETVKKAVGKVISEGMVVTPKGFLLKTEKLSAKTKEMHELIYKACVTAYNKASMVLDAASKEEANSSFSNYRSASMDSVYNLNGVKLHELYLGNISDLDSAITLDSIPYIKISRDYGTFENWQLDFMAACMSSRNGWALTVYDPFKRGYTNIVVDDCDRGLPLGAIPVIAMDMNEHAYNRDYGIDKRSYIVAMMREFNWAVIEARIIVAERSQLQDLWQIVPLVNSQPTVMLNTAAAQAAPVPVEPVPNQQIPVPQSQGVMPGPGFR